MWQLIIPAISTILDKIIPDAGEASRAKAELLTLQAKGELDALLGQLEINKEEAKSSSVFVAGWRPFAGWVGGVGLAYAAIIEPVMRFAASVGFNYSGAFPAVDTDITMQVLLGLLGLGAFRSYEKHKGVAS